MLIKWSSDDYFLYFVVQFKDISPWSYVDDLADASADAFGAEDAPRHVDDLQSGAAFVGDEPIAVAVEGKGL